MSIFLSTYPWCLKRHLHRKTLRGLESNRTRSKVAPKSAEKMEPKGQGQKMAPQTQGQVPRTRGWPMAPSWAQGLTMVPKPQGMAQGLGNMNPKVPKIGRNPIYISRSTAMPIQPQGLASSSIDVQMPSVPAVPTAHGCDRGHFFTHSSITFHLFCSQFIIKTNSMHLMPK